MQAVAGVLSRYVELSDAATRSNAEGRYIAEEEEMIEHKALTIVSCFLKSEIPPKVQVHFKQSYFLCSAKVQMH